MKAPPVVVVGAGIGGLAAALLLAAKGLEVVVLERSATLGGKLREIDVDGRPMDAGPTVLTMRWVFEELFAEVGASLDDALRLSPVGILARHAWNNRERFDLYADLERSTEAIGRFSGAAEARRYVAFCERARSIYDTLEQPFLRSAQPNPVSLANRVGWRGIGDLARISPFATMWSSLGGYFHDPRLRQLFGRYATYCGSSPFLAPATLMLVAHVERQGVWLVDGGMHRIAEVFANLITARGGSIRPGTEVTEIVEHDGRAIGVRLADGETLDAAAVLFNGDTAALADGLLGRTATRAVPKTTRAQRSLSALTWHLRVRTHGLPLLRHGVLFGASSAREFDDLFKRHVVPDDPTVYLCAQDRDARDEDDGRTLDAPERLMCLVNAPANADTTPMTTEEIARCTDRMFKKLADCGLRLDAPTHPPRITTPSDFARLFPATGGALYGRATHGWAASFERPNSRSRMPGLYLAGGSVHPGPGLPMAALSGRLAATAVLTDLGMKPRASTSKSRKAGTSGGTSTR